MNPQWPAVTQGSLTAWTHTQGSLQEPLQGDYPMHDRNHDEWSRLGKLIFLSAISALGTLGNIFAISAVMTEDQLRKKGNVLLVNLMLASLLVTVVVLPVDIVVLLAGWIAPAPTCPTKWVLTCLAAHTSLTTLPCLALENRLRIIGHPIPAAGLLALIIFCWTTSVSLMCAQWATGLGPSHCEDSQPPDPLTYKIFTGTAGIMLILAPLSLTFAVHASTLLTAHSNIRPHRRSETSSENLKPSLVMTERELALPATNLAVSAIAGSCWAVGIASDWWADDSMLRSLKWFPLGAATSTGFLYGIHKPFREAYIQLFHYCCCKTSVSISHRSRSTDASAATASAVTTAARPASDVRVHIIPAYNMYTTQTTREQRQMPFKPIRSKDVRRQTQTHRKDVYEL